MIRKLLLFTILATFFQSCAVYGPSYSMDEEERLTPQQRPQKQAAYTLYLIGDAGKSTTEVNKKTLRFLSDRLDTSKGRDGVIFLGDNNYPSGLPDTSDSYRKQAEEHLNAQIRAVKPHESDIIFVAGNHDWRLGLNAVKRQKAYLQEHLQEQLSYLPEPGCGGPVIKEINQNLVLLLLDSQWWMENWNEHEDINKGCQVQTRDQYLDELYNLFQIYQERTIVVAMHHPMFTFGSHGGQFSLDQILFPFRDLNPNLYIPLPFIGSTLRRNAGIRQDAAYPKFVELKKAILDRAAGYENIIFVSGHEHNLQYIEENGHPFIVSGAGAKQTPGRAGGSARYTSGQGGFASLEFYDDGSIYALFFNAESRSVDYVHRIQGPRDSLNYVNFEEYRLKQDSVTRAILPENDKTSPYRYLRWGRKHLDKYYEPVSAPVLDLNRSGEGLSTVNKSGDNRLNVLRMRNFRGEDYLLRSLRRNPYIKKGTYRGTEFEDVLQEVYSFAHPYAPFIIAPMAEALDLFHTEARLVYMPRQPVLSIYNGEFGGELYLLEKAPDKNPSVVKSFGAPDSITTTYEMLEKYESNPSYVVDLPFFLRNRLFDMIIGDWNRKEIHWHWAEYAADSSRKVLARAIPSNRLQAFSSFDGLFPQLANKSNPSLRQFQSFGEDIPRIRWYNNYARFLDKRFLTELEWREWEEQLTYIENNLSDEVIEKAIALFPAEIRAMGGEEIARLLKKRRENIREMARDYYKILMENVDVVGTNGADHFEIVRFENGDTEVKVSTGGIVKYHRTFREAETSEIHCYGLDGNDLFSLRGYSEDGIKVRIIGGDDEDKVSDSSSVSDLVRKTLVYDRREGMTIEGGEETSKRLTKDYFKNTYNYKDYDQNYLLLWPTASYIPDRGFSLGGVLNYRIFTFKREPYAQDHQVKAQFSTRNKSVLLEYQGIFEQTFGPLDVILGFRAQSPQYRINYFGMGNEAEKDDSRSIDYNQLRQEEIKISGGLKFDFAQGGYFSLGPFYQTIDVDPRENSAFSLSDTLSPFDENIYKRTHFSGIELGAIYDSRNIDIAPTQGMRFKTNLSYTNNLDANQSLGSLESNIRFYQTVDGRGKLIWATQLGFDYRLGDFLFYQSASVGGPTTIRGLRLDRYRGKSAFYNSNDLRYNFGPVENILVPFDFGLTASLDNGRVWMEDQQSNEYHVTGGGGMFFVIMDLTTLNISYHKGQEEGQLIFGLNFDF